MRGSLALFAGVCFLLGPLNGWTRAQSSLPAATASAPQIVTTVARIRALSPQQVAHGVPVELHAILTYYQPAEGQIFAQDPSGGIFLIPPPKAPPLRPGQSVLIRGVTVPSFAANLRATEIVPEGPTGFPPPVAVSWRELFQSTSDCRYVSVTGIVRSATLQSASANADAYLLIDLQTEGGTIRVHVEGIQGLDPLALLDAEVRLQGVAGGLFDGKFQQLGAEVWVSSAQHMRVLRPSSGRLAALPLTDMSRIMSSYEVRDHSRRVHVRGSITFYEPGLQLVVETPDRKAVLVNSYEQSPLRTGQVVDVVGFPNPHEYSEVMNEANVLPSPRMEPIQPLAVPWEQALAGRYPYDLISMEGRITAEFRERQQDTLILQAGSHVFSAILPRTVWDQDFDQLSLPEYPVGSTVRVTGVCMVHAGGPWNTERWFDLEMRSAGDVVVLRNPSWWTVRHLLSLSALLLALMIAALVWAVLLQARLRRRTDQLRLNMEAEAARERKAASLEADRRRILEAINSMRLLDEVLLMILRLMSRQLDGASCWCELAEGSLIGEPVPDQTTLSLLRREIFAGTGERMGSLCLAVAATDRHAAEVIERGARLAALAVDNRRLYDTLMHRSQFDQLTNAANRFLLESRLDEALAHAARTGTPCALIYIDLDSFKQVNDRYGHRAGDLLLQQIATRFSEKLRGMDTLARVGGDEFIALIPVVRNRAEVDEIAHRLLSSFDTEFQVESNQIAGSASIGTALYPEDGLTKDELKRVADAAMYARKPGPSSSPSSSPVSSPV